MGLPVLAAMLFKVGTQDANAHPASPCLGLARYEEELERNGQPIGRAQHRAVHLAQNMRQRCHTPIRSPLITLLVVVVLAGVVEVLSSCHTREVLSCPPGPPPVSRVQHDSSNLSCPAKGAQILCTGLSKVRPKQLTLQHINSNWSAILKMRAMPHSMRAASE